MQYQKFENFNDVTITADCNEWLEHYLATQDEAVRNAAIDWFIEKNDPIAETIFRSANHHYRYGDKTLLWEYGEFLKLNRKVIRVTSLYHSPYTAAKEEVHYRFENQFFYCYVYHLMQPVPPVEYYHPWYENRGKMSNSDKTNFWFVYTEYRNKYGYINP